MDTKHRDPQSEGVGTLYGIKVVADPSAFILKTQACVEPWPIKKRRRGWRVVVREVEAPAWRFKDYALHAHPSFIARMKEGGALRPPNGFRFRDL